MFCKETADYITAVCINSFRCEYSHLARTWLKAKNKETKLKTGNGLEAKKNVFKGWLPRPEGKGCGKKNFSGRARVCVLLVVTYKICFIFLPDSIYFFQNSVLALKITLFYLFYFILNKSITMLEPHQETTFKVWGKKSKKYLDF